MEANSNQTHYTSNVKWNCQLLCVDPFVLIASFETLFLKQAAAMIE